MVRVDLWNEEQTAELRRLFVDGNDPSAIAARVGRSRNAVIGRLHRLGLKRVSERSKAVCAEKSPRQEAGSAGGLVMAVRAAAERRNDPPNRDAGPIPPALPLTAAVSITKLEHRQCRWIGELPELMTLDTPVYCGARTAEGSSWCPEHRSRVFAVRGVAPCQKPKPQSPLNIISRAR